MNAITDFTIAAVCLFENQIEINEKYILNAKLILMYMYFVTSNESTISILYTYEMTLYPNIEKSIKMFPSRHISFTDQIQY